MSGRLKRFDIFEISFVCLFMIFYGHDGGRVHNF